MEGRKYVYSSPPPQATLRPLKQPLYDTEVIPSAGTAAQLNFFQRPIGQTFANAPVGTGKTLADTNLNQAAMLGTPNEFDVFGFNVRLGNTVTVADFQAVMDQGVFTFNFGQGRPWLQCQLSDLPTGTAISGSTAIDGAAAQVNDDLPVQGVSSVKELYSFCVGKKPVRIRSNETFGVVVSWPNANPNPVVFVRMTVLLRGIFYASL
jgi:hypothetical protein